MGKIPAGIRSTDRHFGKITGRCKNLTARIDRAEIASQCPVVIDLGVEFMKKLILVASMLAFAAAQPAFAGEKKAFVVVNEEIGVPVFPYDFKDRPYEVLGEVKAGVRKATVIIDSTSQRRIRKS